MTFGSTNRFKKFPHVRGQFAALFFQIRGNSA